VLRAGWNNGGYGNLIEIDHGRGIITRYGHLSAIQISAGAHVTRGQQIGRVGSTGRSTGNHLHYEVRIDNSPVNPIPFMRSTDYLMAMKRAGNNASMDAVALGGPDGVKLVVDPASLELVRGSAVDFVEDLGGAAFKVTNPNAQSGCGCGSSFSV